MAEGADGGFRDFLPLSRRTDRPDECLDPVHLTDHDLVPLVVAGEVGEDPGGAGHDVPVLGRQRVHEALEQALKSVLKTKTNRKVSILSYIV
jgi:hypothetical protein